MPDVALILCVNLAVIAACMLALWALSLPVRDVSYVDAFWPTGILITAVVSFLLAQDGALARKALVLALTTTWGVRLAAHLYVRWRVEGPDKRYAHLLETTKSPLWLHTLLTVFLLQGALLWIVSLPVQLAQIAAAPARIGALGWWGAGLAAAGIAFETAADWQLARFRAEPANDGQVMDRGLWSWTRHPNYFGEVCVWWGLFLVAAETSVGLASAVGPLLLTWSLLQWSGAPLVEKSLRASRPGYADYARRTSMFIPWPPRR